MKKMKLIIGLCHGVFDIVHIGHIRHFEFAKSMCDKLYVSVTHENYVNKDIKRPLFDQQTRITFLERINVIDEVIPSNSKFADKVIKQLKPSYYFKDIEYKNKKNDQGLIQEKKALSAINGKIIFTDLGKFSSGDLYNYHVYKKNPKLSFLKNYDLNFYENCLKSLKKKTFIVYGEFIIDTYENVKVLGIPSKATCISVQTLSINKTYGGAFAIAMHMSDFVNKIIFITNISDQEEKKLNKIKNKNIEIIKVLKEDIVKKRYIDISNNSKVLETNKVLINEPINTRKILDKIKNKADGIIIADYGHNLIKETEINDFLKKYKGFYSINVQTNSFNRGYNPISKYKYAKFLSLDTHELEINFKVKNITNKELYIKKLYKTYKCPVFLTLGKDGLLAFNGKIFFELPALSNIVVDPVGAGDAFYSLCSIIYNECKDIKISSYIGSLSAGLATKYIGNSDYVQYKDIISNIKRNQ